ncbi:MAG: flagellar basal body-associated FliL family protein [Desulfatiglandaceae bacterium]|jgi:flagellar basal body-associated protein FliL
MMNDDKGEATFRLRKWILLFLLAAMIVGSVVSLKYPYVLRIPQSIFHKAYIASLSKGQVKCSVAYNVDERHYLRLKLAIACDGNKQRLELTRNLPRFKHELLMELGNPDMKEAVKNRDFKAVKAHFVRIVNRLVKRPVSKVYIEHYFYD